jgi:hypothetical protein
MGIRAAFSEISSEVFEQVRAGLEPDMHEIEWHSVDKAWYDIFNVLKEKGPPLDLAIVGDCLHPLSPHSLADFCNGGHEYYFGFVSPRTVQAVSEALSGLKLTDVKTWYNDCGIAFGNYDQTMFQEMKAAYCNAAKRGNALRIGIA